MSELEALDTAAPDGAAVLDEVHAFLGGYVAWPGPAECIATTLWAAHTHLYPGFESTPRLALLSPQKQCGKSRVLELLELLCRGAETLSGTSPAYLYRRIGKAGRSPSCWTRPTRSGTRAGARP